MISPLRSLPKGTLASVEMTCFFYSPARERRYYEFCSRSKTKYVGRQGKTKFNNISECARIGYGFEKPNSLTTLYCFTLFRFSERRKFAPESGGFNTGCGVRRWSPELPAHGGSAARVAGGRLWAETCSGAAIGAPNGKQG